MDNLIERTFAVCPEAWASPVLTQASCSAIKMPEQEACELALTEAIWIWIESCLEGLDAYQYLRIMEEVGERISEATNMVENELHDHDHNEEAATVNASHDDIGDRK